MKVITLLFILILLLSVLSSSLSQTVAVFFRGFFFFIVVELALLMLCVDLSKLYKDEKDQDINLESTIDEIHLHQLSGRPKSLSKYTRSSSPTRRHTSHKKPPRSKLLTRNTILKCQDQDFEEIEASIKEIETECRNFLNWRRDSTKKTKKILDFLFSQIRLIFKEEVSKFKTKDLKTLDDPAPDTTSFFRSESDELQRAAHQVDLKREMVFFKQRWEQFCSFLQKGIIAQLEASSNSLLSQLLKIEKKKEQKDLEIKGAQNKAKEIRLKHEKSQKKVEGLETQLRRSKERGAKYSACLEIEIKIKLEEERLDKITNEVKEWHERLTNQHNHFARSTVALREEIIQAIECWNSCFEGCIVSCLMELKSLFNEFAYLFKGPFRNEKKDVVVGLTRVVNFESQIASRLCKSLEEAEKGNKQEEEYHAALSQFVKFLQILQKYIAEKVELERIALHNFEREQQIISQRGIADSILSNIKEIGSMTSEEISFQNLVGSFIQAQLIFGKLEKEGMNAIQEIEREREYERQSSVKVVRLYEIELKKEKRNEVRYSPVKAKLGEHDWINRLLHILYNEWTQSASFEKTWLKIMKVVYNRNRSWFLAPFEPVGAVFREKAIRLHNFRIANVHKTEEVKIELDAKFDEGYCIALTSGLKVKLPFLQQKIIPLFVHLTVTDFTGTIIVSLNRKKKEECWYCLKPGSQLLFDMKTFIGQTCKLPLDILPMINSHVVSFNRAKVKKYIYPNTKPITIPFIF